MAALDERERETHTHTNAHLLDHGLQRDLCQQQIKKLLIRIADKINDDRSVKEWFLSLFCEIFNMGQNVGSHLRIHISLRLLRILN